MEISVGLVALLAGLSFGVAWGIATLFIKIGSGILRFFG